MNDERPKVKIAHISDLHCDGSKKWIEAIDYLKKCLIEEKPNILVITGDCCNNPFKRYFKCLCDEVEGILKEIANLNSDVALVTVPGNHDCSIFGNNILGFKRTLFEKYEKKLNKLYPNSVENVLYYILEKYKVAIFPFDSNFANRYVGFAQGYIPNPELQFGTWSEEYRKLAFENNIPYDQVLKIVILHHHPLPLPITHPSEKELERFLIFENAYQFLQAAENHQINLILHGHKHIGGTAEYKTGLNQSSLRISACGSTASTNSANKELIIYDISDSGSILEKKYIADFADPNFRVAKENIPLIPYDYVRKQRNANLNIYNNYKLKSEIQQTPITRIHTKTKIVEIKDGPSPITSGDCIVSIYHQKIDWDESYKAEECHLLEELRADTGRIPWVSFIFNDRPIVPNELRETFIDIETRKPRHETACEVEEFVFDANIKKTFVENQINYCEIQYPVFAGFCLFQDEHAATYPSWSGPREEACSIQANYKTDILELIVRFPSDESFPSKATIAAYFKTERNAKDSLQILKRDYMPVPEEVRHLYSTEILKFRPGLREISLLIRYPQPDVAYSLRWRVPFRDVVPIKNYEEDEIAEELREQICKVTQKVIIFYDKIEQYIKRAFKDKDLEVSLFSLHNEKTLGVSYVEVVKGPNQYENKKFYATRGIVGKAIKTKKVQFFCNPSFRDGHPNVVVERLTADFNPHYVLCLPLVFPKPQGNICDPQGKIVGIVSVLSHVRDSSLRIFDQQAMGMDNNIEIILESVYKVIIDALYETFNCEA